MSGYKLEMYNILNNITPHFKKTRFPYNYWTPNKITDTQNKIKLVFSKNEEGPDGSRGGEFLPLHVACGG